MSFRCTTKVIKGAVDPETSTDVYNHLKDTIKWEESISSRREGNAFTRNGKSIDLAEYPKVLKIILDVLDKFKSPYKYLIAGAYLNHYENGTMWSPNHTHQGLHSLVISTGATRNFVLGKKIVQVENGTAVMFGSANHGVPRMPEVTQGRISIAVFLQLIN